MNLPPVRIKIIGRVKIQDKLTKEVIIEKNNAIHAKNMSVAIARGLTNKSNSFIRSMKFGNGGTVPTEGTDVIFKAPNIDGNDLYNPTYEEVLDSTDPDFETGNYITYQEDGDLFQVIICVVNISSNQPGTQLATGQQLIDNKTNEFAFDELGLFTRDNKMLTHVIFPPRLKTQGKELIITYSLTIIVTDEMET
jgi:uncharacterized protein affecting Mg2+/Co2+ transport